MGCKGGGRSAPGGAVFRPNLLRPLVLRRWPESQGGVGPAEPEGVVQREPNLRGTRLVRNVIEVALRVWIFVIYSGRQHTALDREHGEYRFDRPRRTERMPRHRLGQH